MSWAARFRVRQYLKGSLWFFPLVGAVAGPFLALLTKQADDSITVSTFWRYEPSTVGSVLTTIVGAAVGLTGFVITVTVLAIQMATSTFSGRYMRLWVQDGLLKATLAALAGTLTFSYSLLRQVGAKPVPEVGVTAAGFLILLSLALFLIFFGRFILRLRPAAVAKRVSDVARETVTTVTEAAQKHAAPAGTAVAGPVQIVRSERAGSVQAVHVRGLVTWASKRDCVLELRATVGDPLTAGQPLIAVHGEAVLPATAGRQLRGMVALGLERSADQDVGFAIRVMVDIAIRALSPAINDPTTGVQVLDHLANVLQLLGSMPLRAPLTFPDQEGTPRLLMPAPSWEDYLTLAVTEIREYGATAIQVTRRLRAMLDELEKSVRPEHRSAVEAQLALLDAAVATGFAGSADNDQARVPDRQGIGGPAERVLLS